jgi:DNA invertase Pin-like site-specific DNA recombinase
MVSVDVSAGQRAIAYVRVSVVGDRAARGRFESPDMQRAAIDAWARPRAVQIVREVRDLNRSGGTLTRPGLTDALGLLRDGAADGIVVARSDRASRRTLDGLGLIEDLERGGWWIAAADGTIDTTSRAGRMATTMFFAAAQNEYERYREQSAESHRRAIVERGRHMGPAPLGYARDSDGRLVPHPDLSWVPGHVFARRAAGAGWVTISRELDERGVRTPDGRHVSPHLLRRMVRRRVYVGEARHGEYRTHDAHPPLVTEGMWLAANRAQPAVASAPAVHRVHAESLLRGLLRCAGCRYALKRVPDRGGERWVCRTGTSERAATHDCAAPALLSQRAAADVERHVIDWFLHEAAGARGGRTDDTDTGPLEDAVRAAESTLDELSSLDVRRALGADRWSALVAEARGELDAARGRLADAAAPPHRAVVVADLADVWPVMPPDVRGDALRSVIQAVIVHGRAGPIDGRVRVVAVWEPTDLPRRGSRNFTARPWID